MPLTDDELIPISDLPKGQNQNATLQPDIITLHEVRDTTDSVFALPYQNTTIDVFGGADVGTWSLNFQNPLQRVVLDVEIFFGNHYSEGVAPNLSSLELTLTGFSSCALFAPLDSYDAQTPDNYFGLAVTGATPVIKPGGKRRRLEHTGQIVFPLTAVLLSDTPLTASETHRSLSVTLQRKDPSQTVSVPVIGGMVYSNPLPSDRDRALVANQ